MLSARFKPWHVPLFLSKYAWLSMRKRPLLVHFEVTLRCNARCGFCDYWKTPAEAREHELASYADAARHFNPMLITFTGGEPLMRRDLEEIVAAVHAAVRLKYVTLITHGAMLTPERAKSAFEAGVQSVSVSIDGIGATHDMQRGVVGSFDAARTALGNLTRAGLDVSVNSQINRLSYPELGNILIHIEPNE